MIPKGHPLRQRISMPARKLILKLFVKLIHVREQPPGRFLRNRYS